MSRLDEAKQAKIAKRRALEAAGVSVHPYCYQKTHTVAQALALLGSGELVRTAGRIVSLRSQGKVTFLNLTEETGSIQVMLHLDRLGENFYAQVNKLDPGDFLGIEGLVEATRTGETTVMAEKITVLGKALRPLPTAWNAAEDKEVRFRQRYLDLLVNQRANYLIRSRFTILKELRAYLQDKVGYTEVDTPVLQTLYGGTNARPFTTHMNALNHDFYLRVAPELYLKRLIVGGFEKIFEVAKNFRNEGIDQTHQPEFTMVEWYEAYADYRRMMEVAEGLIKHLNRVVNQSDKLMVGDRELELEKSWAVYSMYEALEKFAGIKVAENSDENLQELLDRHELKLIGAFGRGKAIFALFDKLVCGQLIEPTWIIDYPKEVSPLAKQHRDNPDLVERYELYIGGKEICDGWSEITDPLDQRERFENEQQKMRDGDDEAQPLDEEFLAAMEYGLPPLGGLGMGIDRLVMLLTNEWSIREVIAFPTLRPVAETAEAVAEIMDKQAIDDLVQPVTRPNSGDGKVAFNMVDENH